MAIINTNLGGTDASDGDVLDAADLNDTFDAAATSAILGVGIIEVDDGTTAYDTAYVDIAFAASDLATGDVIRISVNGANGHTTDGLQWQWECRDTASDGNVVQYSAASTCTDPNTFFFQEGYIMQNPTVNTYIKGWVKTNIGINNTASHTVLNSGDRNTTEANVFATAWTLRLNYRFSGDGGAGNTDLVYVVERLRST
jgi:hypothetical protein